MHYVKIAFKDLQNKFLKEIIHHVCSLRNILMKKKTA